MPQRKHRLSRSIIYGYLPSGVKWLLISNTAIYILMDIAQRLSPDPGAFAHTKAVWLELSAQMVLKFFFLWQFVTYMFLHGGVWHLLVNMLTLWMFGVQLEHDWGTRRFLKYYFICGVGAGVCVVLINALIGDWGIPTLGASGAIMGLLLAFGVLYPDMTVLMGFLFPIKAKYMVMIYAAVELYFSFGPNTGISSVAHLGGMAVGYLYLKGKMPSIGLPDVSGRYRQWRMQRAKKKFQIYMRKHGGRGPWVN
ncbi:MAG TPA: rhomboid family intramembrane serine protease [Bryobacteraceae bacterium]|nr:rhomboid family intramembrane serine protease [Bryobacteraceae bacterium]